MSNVKKKANAVEQKCSAQAGEYPLMCIFSETTTVYYQCQEGQGREANKKEKQGEMQQEQQQQQQRLAILILLLFHMEINSISLLHPNKIDAMMSLKLIWDSQTNLQVSQCSTVCLAHRKKL